MLYLKASSQIEFLDEYEGRKGRFAKIFAINDLRNKNGWRVTWQSIKQHIGTAIGKPGIEYTKCEGTVCDLDHTDGATYEQAKRVQEPYRVSTIIDYQLDEASHTAYFIHEFHDEDAYEAVKSGKLKYVSPSIWPDSGGYEVLGTNEKGLPVIDVFHWRFLHSAFVNNPAFGDDAKVVATCEGEGCQMRLLTAAAESTRKTQIQTLIFDKDKFTLEEARAWLRKHDFKVPEVDETSESYRFRQKEPSEFQEQSFRTIELADGIKAVIGRPSSSTSSSTTAAASAESAITYGPGDDDLAPIKTVPLLVRHKDKLMFVSVTEEEARKIQEREVNESAVLEVLRMNNSFHSCACNALQNMDEKDRKELEAVKAELEEEKKKTKELESKLKAAQKSIKGQEKDDDDDDDDKDGGQEQKESKAKKARVEESSAAAIKELKASYDRRIAQLESEAKAPLVAKMLEARQNAGATEEEIEAFKASIENKSFDEIKAQAAAEEIFYKSLQAKAESRGGEHFEFNGGSAGSIGALAGKSLEEIAGELEVRA